MIITPDTKFSDLETMLGEMDLTMFIQSWGTRYVVTVVNKTGDLVEAKHSDLYVAANAAFHLMLN